MVILPSRSIDLYPRYGQRIELATSSCIGAALFEDLSTRPFFRTPLFLDLSSIAVFPRLRCSLDIVASDDNRGRLAPATRARVISTGDNADLRE
jgi:hypothetical protein